MMWPPPTPPRRRGRTIGIGVGVTVGVLVILGIIGAVAKKNNNPSNTSLVPNPGAAVPAANGANVPSGYTTFSSSADRFTIDLPAAWKSVDITSPGAQAAMNEIEQSNPKLHSALGQSALRLAEEGIVLVGINPIISPQGFAANVNVAAKADPAFSDSDLAQVAAALPAEYSKLGGTETGHSYVTLDGHQSLRVTETLPLNLPNGSSATIDQTQYYLGANGFVFVLTLSGDDPALETIASTFATN